MNRERCCDLRHAVEEYLRDCCSRETPPRIKELAARLGITREALVLEFARRYGITLSAFMREGQVRYAEELLRESSYNLTRVAYLAAFGTRRTFFRAYRRLRGVTPGDSRRRPYQSGRT